MMKVKMLTRNSMGTTSSSRFPVKRARFLIFYTLVGTRGRARTATPGPDPLRCRLAYFSRKAK